MCKSKKRHGAEAGEKTRNHPCAAERTGFELAAVGTGFTAADGFSLSPETVTPSFFALAIIL